MIEEKPKPKTLAERQKDYRERLKDGGLRYNLMLPRDETDKLNTLKAALNLPIRRVIIQAINSLYESEANKAHKFEIVPTPAMKIAIAYLMASFNYSRLSVLNLALTRLYNKQKRRDRRNGRVISFQVPVSDKANDGNDNTHQQHPPETVSPSPEV